MARVGILGLGKMGSAFALNLLSKGNEVHVYNRSKEKLRDLVAKGAIAHPSPYELAKSVDVIITSLNGPGCDRQRCHGKGWGPARHEETSAVD